MAERDMTIYTLGTNSYPIMSRTSSSSAPHILFTRFQIQILKKGITLPNIDIQIFLPAVNQVMVTLV